MIVIKRINGERCVYQGEALIANIYDNRKRIGMGNVTDNWAVAWRSGRYDRHGTYAEARDNALNGCGNSHKL